MKPLRTATGARVRARLGVPPGLFPAAAVLTGLAGAGAPACGQTVSVSAMCNIYGAGHSSVRASCTDAGPGPGILPVRVDLPAGSICVEFRNVAGLISFCTSGCGSPAGPDGVASSQLTLESVDGISGITATRVRGLVGVFLGASEPANPAPPILTFTDFSFSQLAPLVAQQFYIGDGLTGTGTGTSQRFMVPAGATRLYLGIADGLVPCVGWYGDNSGTVTADVVVSGIVDQPVSAGTCPGVSAPFSVTTGGSGPFGYQWQLMTSPGVWQTMGNDPFPLPCGGGAFAYASPINSPSVHIGVHACAGVSQYPVRCVVTNACGSATSNPVMLSIATACNIADIVGIGGSTAPGGLACPDGLLTGDDFNAFIAAFAAGEPLADIVGIGGLPPADGLITGDDFNAFIAAFAQGCP